MLVDYLNRVVKMGQEELELEDNIGHHKRFWIIKRIAWGLMFVLILVALFGLTGGGSNSEERLQAGNLTVRYEKYSRKAFLSKIHVHLNQVEHDTFMLRVSSKYFQSTEIVQVMPEPLFQKLDKDIHVFYFLKGKGVSDVDVSCYLKQYETGFCSFQVGSSSDELIIKQIVYP